MEEENIKSDTIIEMLNSEKSKQYIGAFVFVLTLMVVGVIGNLHVIIVFALRKHSNNRTFILTLGLADFYICCVGMPITLVDVRNPLTFTMVAWCKVLRFTTTFISLFSIILLMIIAVDRYRKICHPFAWQISTRVAIYLCLGTFIMSSSLSWPTVFLYGHSTKNTSLVNVTGVECFAADEYLDTDYFAIFNFFLIMFAVVALIVLVIMYSFIARAISISNSCNSKEENPKTKRIEKKEADVVVNDSKSPVSSTDSNTSNVTGTVDIDDIDINNSNNKPGRKPEAVELRKHVSAQKLKRAKRITLIFVLITIVFVASYVPHQVLMIMWAFNENLVTNMTFIQQIVFHIFTYTFFINNMANCFIYGFYDTTFRSELKNVYSRLFCRLFRKRTI